jgi:hypothetical protein
MKFHLKNLLYLALFFSMAGFIFNSCKKPDAPANNNNNTNNNNTNNPDGPTLKITKPGQDTTATPFDFVQFEIIATAQTGTTLTKVVRHDGIAADTDISSVIPAGQNPAILDDIYFIPNSVTNGTTIVIKYTVTDSKGNSNTVARNITVGAKAKTFALYTVPMSDQTYSAPTCFLNTGGISTDKHPQIWTVGQVNPPNTANRKLVDLVCLKTAGQAEILAATAADVFDSIPLFHNLWADADRLKTDIRKLPGFTVDNTTTAASIKAAFDKQPKYTKYQVQAVFSPTDVYGFLTVDGRYGAFYCVANGGFWGQGVKMTMAVESR